MIISLAKIFIALLLTIVLATLVLLLLPFQRNGNIFHVITRLYSRCVLTVCGVRVVSKGSGHIDFSRNYIYVANHASLFDIPAVLIGIPATISIVYKKELERIPIFGWGMKFGKTYIAIDRHGGQDALQSLEEAANKIRQGVSILLFAEGTRSEDGKLQPFKRGAFSLAVRAGVPIVPVTINGSFHILQKHSLRITPGTITIVLERPIEPPAANGRETELQLRDEVRKRIEQHYIQQ
ncbi:MAG: 1-acyl-sn-glycerol-3-phosphate acyltransferase [Ignavibacteriae bacterium]|nr:1-acyl-sn-glycerol-3-phosphate acyltransferase [Ignavibacteriota bacterium]